MVPSTNGGVAKIAQALRHHPDAAVCVCLAAIALPAIALTANPWSVGILSVVFFVIYAALRTMNGRREERMAERKLDHLEQTTGKRLQAKAGAQKAKRVKGSASVPAVPGRSGK